MVLWWREVFIDWLGVPTVWTSKQDKTISTAYVRCLVLRQEHRNVIYTVRRKWYAQRRRTASEACGGRQTWQIQRPPAEIFRYACCRIVSQNTSLPIAPPSTCPDHTLLAHRRGCINTDSAVKDNNNNVAGEAFVPYDGTTPLRTRFSVLGHHDFTSPVEICSYISYSKWCTVCSRHQ